MRSNRLLTWLLRAVAAAILLPCVLFTLYAVASSFAMSKCAGLPSTPPNKIRACDLTLKIPGILPAQKVKAGINLAYAYLAVPNADAALTAFSEALKADPLSWRTHVTEAEALRQMRRLNDAADHLTTAITPSANYLADLLWQRANVEDEGGLEEQAVDDYIQAIALTSSKQRRAQYLTDRGGHYESNAKTWDKALSDDNAAIALIDIVGSTKLSADAYRGRGRIEYLQGAFDAARWDFQRQLGENNIFPDAGYDMIWLYLSEERGGKDAVADLRKITRRQDLSKWPGPIISVLLGDTKPETVTAPSLPRLWSRADQEAAAHCELWFYLGEDRLARDDREGARQLFTQVLATHINEYREYQEARLELERMQLP